MTTEQVTPATPAPPSGDVDPETDTPPEPSESSNSTDDLGDAGKQAIERMKVERNDAQRQLKAAQRELAAAKQASMSESERAVAEAETRGRQSALTEFGKRLARAEFDAVAARRNPDVNTDDIVEFVDMGRFLTDDGEVDRKALQAAVDRLVPATPAGPPSFDGGVRSPAKTNDMNAIIRAQARGGRTA